jgi:ketosteroid isomerase-like protein
MGETGTHPNAEAIRRGFEAFMRGDVEAARPLFAPDVVWHVSGHGPLAGDFHGFDDIARWGGELVARSGGTFREELLHVIADDAWGYQLATFRAEREGRKIEDRSVNVFRMHNGRVLECWVLFGDPAAFDAFFA